MTGPGIAIIGGGLAGLAAANALASRGFATELYERAPTLTEIGAGINISAQAVKALSAIGLGDRVARVANVSQGIFQRDMHTGARLAFRDAAAAAQRYGAPGYTFHRADLLAALASGLDPRTVHLDHRLIRIKDIVPSRSVSAPQATSAPVARP